jgi:methylenetetrahydrofolate dehydrogenase (NADP+)/methenyltetrahydrofolate cyclohydrolase
MEQILFGTPVAEQLDEISKNVFQGHSKDNKKPHLTAITVGDNPASLLYVTRKQEKAAHLGVEFNWLKLDTDTSQETLEEVISKESKATDGLIIQLPLPSHLNPEEAINCIPHEIDVDGLTSYNL